MKRISQKLGLLLLTLLTAAMAYLVFRAWNWSGDFKVYHRTLLHVLQGQPAYSFARDGLGTYKYPPWTLILFLPFIAFTEQTAALLWALLCVGALVFSARILNRSWKLSPFSLALTFAFTFPIWLRHFIDGQVMIPLLALCLVALSPQKPARWGLMSWALSFKLFSLGALGGLIPFRSKEHRRYLVRSVLYFASSCAVLSIPFSLNEPVLTHWLETLTSGNSVLGWDLVYGKANQGLPALFIRAWCALFGKEEYPVAISALSVLGWFALSLHWFIRHSKHEPSPAQRLRALAWIPLLHPLSWAHTFVFAAPLLAQAAQLAIEKRQWRHGLFVGACLLAVGPVTTYSLGEWGRYLELAGIKAWGVIFALAYTSLTTLENGNRN